MFSSSFFFFADFAGKRWNARMEYLKYNASKKKEKDTADARCFSLLLSGILAFVSVKFSVFVGFYHLTFLVLCHTGKERKCLHQGFNPDFPGVKKIAGYIFAAFAANM